MEVVVTMAVAIITEEGAGEVVMGMATDMSICLKTRDLDLRLNLPKNAFSSHRMKNTRKLVKRIL